MKRRIPDEGHPPFEELHAEIFPVDKIAAEADLVVRRAEMKRQNERDEVGTEVI